MSARLPLGAARRRVAGGVIGVALVAGATVAAVATGPGTVGQVADRVAPRGSDVAVVFDTEEIDRFVVEASFRVAERSGAAAATGRTASAGMRRLSRNGATVHAAPDGYLIPLVFLGLPRAAMGGVYGGDVSSIIKADTVVMNQLTASLMGAAVGDVVELRANDGSTQAFGVAAILPNEVVGGTELLMSIEGVERLGWFQDTRTVIWSIDSRAAFDSAVADEGLDTRRNTRVARSWDPPNPDETLSTARTKQLLSEPWYQVLDDDSLTMHPTWVSANLTAGRVLLDPAIRVRAQCHVGVVGALSAALAEVAAAGLGGHIDLANTNTYGGCFNPRYSRVGGFLSRHAWGMAIDMNTVSNCLGCVPQMNCDVVRIFRKHGFAWGGNFRSPDGMHFEWVGELRHQISYPSKYCPNLVAGLGSPPTTGRGLEILVDGVDGFALGDGAH